MAVTAAFQAHAKAYDDDSFGSCAASCDWRDRQPSIRRIYRIRIPAIALRRLCNVCANFCGSGRESQSKRVRQSATYTPCTEPFHQPARNLLHTLSLPRRASIRSIRSLQAPALIPYQPVLGGCARSPLPLLRRWLLKYFPVTSVQLSLAHTSSREVRHDSVAAASQNPHCV
jgi:hypothetical protein